MSRIAIPTRTEPQWQKFFFLEYDPEEASQGEGEGHGGGGMAMLMRAMERGEWDAGVSLMEQASACGSLLLI